MQYVFIQILVIVKITYTHLLKRTNFTNSILREKFMSSNIDKSARKVPLYLYSIFLQLTMGFIFQRGPAKS